VEPVVAKLVLHPEQDKDAAGHANGQARDIDKCKSLVANNIPESDLEIIQ
jgi:hypothetical protein